MNVLASSLSPAMVYDQKFVPALFAQWGPVVSAAAEVSRGMKVLDVGCGTGALALVAADIVGDGGEVTGLDPNPEMLEVARAKPAHVHWRQGQAENLPFADARFDAVASQFAFMFFEDRHKALLEMRRVVRPDGKVAVAVCGDVQTSPGYRVFAEVLDRLFGPETGDAFRAPFVLGRAELLAEIAETAGIDGASVAERCGAVTFDSIEDLVSTERACAWTLGGLLDADQFERLLTESQDALRPFLTQTGSIQFDMPALILSFRKP